MMEMLNIFGIFHNSVNSRPDSRRVPECMWRDGPGFSLCAAPLESSGPGFQSGVVGQTSKRRSGDVLDQRWQRRLAARGGVTTDTINGT